MVNEMLQPAAQHDASHGSGMVETALGGLWLEWSRQGLTRLSLPGGLRRVGQAALAWSGVARDRCTGVDEPVPSFVGDAAEALFAYARGDRIDFSAVPVDLSGVDDFRRDIYRAARELGYGRTMTYGELAEAAGHPDAARQTGAALGRNPVAIVIPCHRITAADGRLGGFSAPGGASTKQRLLSLESAAPLSPKDGQASFAF